MLRVLMSRSEFPKLQLPNIYPKQIELVIADGQTTYHGAYVPPPVKSTEDVPSQIQLTGLIYNGASYVDDPGRPEKGRTCSPAFTTQCNTLFEKMHDIPELGILFDQSKYADPGTSGDNTTSFIGQYLLSLGDKGDGLYPDAPFKLIIAGSIQ